MTDRGAAVAFRFLIAVLVMTAIGVVQIEVERRMLLAQRLHVRAVEQSSELIDRRNRLEVELARQTAPGVLLKYASNETDSQADSFE